MSNKLQKNIGIPETQLEKETLQKGVEQNNEQKEKVEKHSEVTKLSVALTANPEQTVSLETEDMIRIFQDNWYEITQDKALWEKLWEAASQEVRSAIKEIYTEEERKLQKLLINEVGDVVSYYKMFILISCIASEKGVLSSSQTKKDRHLFALAAADPTQMYRKGNTPVIQQKNIKDLFKNHLHLTKASERDEIQKTYIELSKIYTEGKIPRLSSTEFNENLLNTQEQNGSTQFFTTFQLTISGLANGSINNPEAIEKALLILGDRQNVSSATHKIIEAEAPKIFSAFINKHPQFNVQILNTVTDQTQIPFLLIVIMGYLNGVYNNQEQKFEKLLGNKNFSWILDAVTPLKGTGGKITTRDLIDNTVTLFEMEAEKQNKNLDVMSPEEKYEETSQKHFVDLFYDDIKYTKQTDFQKYAQKLSILLSHNLLQEQIKGSNMLFALKYKMQNKQSSYLETLTLALFCMTHFPVCKELALEAINNSEKFFENSGIASDMPYSEVTKNNLLKTYFEPSMQNGHIKVNDFEQAKIAFEGMVEEKLFPTERKSDAA